MSAGAALTEFRDPVEARVGARTIRFLNLLRGVAVLLVVYDHLGAIWPEAKGRSWIVTRTVRRWVTEPLGIIQDFGFLGVAIFFLISGFIITHVGQRESRLQFAVKRVLRIYPPLIVAILVIVGITVVQGRELDTLGTYLRSFTLVNYFSVPQTVVHGAAWTLVVEMLFYVAVFLVLPLLRSRPQVANLLVLLGVALIIAESKDHGGNFFLFAASVAYVPYLLLGQLVYLRWVRRITVAEYAALSVATYVVAVFGLRRIHTAFLPADNSYLISATIAFAIFVAALTFEESIRIPRAISFTSTISYSLYLLHGAIGFFVLDELVGRIPFTLAIVVAVVVSIAASWVSYRLVEAPSQRAARWILARLAR